MDGLCPTCPGVWCSRSVAPWLSCCPPFFVKVDVFFFRSPMTAKIFIRFERPRRVFSTFRSSIAVYAKFPLIHMRWFVFYMTAWLEKTGWWNELAGNHWEGEDSKGNDLRGENWKGKDANGKDAQGKQKGKESGFYENLPQHDAHPTTAQQSKSHAPLPACASANLDPGGRLQCRRVCWRNGSGKPGPVCSTLQMARWPRPTRLHAASLMRHVWIPRRVEKNWLQ